MTKAEKIRDDRSDRPGELIFGIAISLLLHVVLWLGRDYWLQAVAPRQQPTPEIPVEFVEVPPLETKPPPETSRRAVNDSVAGGEAKPQKPLTAVKPAPATPKTSNSNSPNPPAPKPPTQPPLASPPPKPPTAKPPSPPPKSKPQRTPTAPTTPPPQPTSPPQRTATAPATPPPQLESPKPVPTPTTPLPASPPPKPLTAKPPSPPPKSKPPTPTAPAATDSNSLPRQQPEKPPTSSPPRQAAKTTPSKPTQSAPASGAASKLGGPVTLSQRQPGDNSQAALPNTNRSNPGEAGIDARQEVDLSSYLEQLRQRVRRQWIPGITQSSRRTVIHFAVNRSGQVSQVRIAQPSGFSVTDEAALNAVQRAAPFAPLPPEYTDNYIQIRFTFNINVSGELELWGGG